MICRRKHRLMQVSGMQGIYYITVQGTVYSPLCGCLSLLVFVCVWGERGGTVEWNFFVDTYCTEKLAFFPVL